jgi:hypothetical protein
MGNAQILNKAEIQKLAKDFEMAESDIISIQKDFQEMDKDKSGSQTTAGIIFLDKVQEIWTAKNLD